MKITLAKTAGFCFGVDRAVALVEQAVKDGKKKLILLYQKAISFGSM